MYVVPEKLFLAKKRSSWKFSSADENGASETVRVAVEGAHGAPDGGNTLNLRLPGLSACRELAKRHALSLQLTGSGRLVLTRDESPEPIRDLKVAVYGPTPAVPPAPRLDLGEELSRDAASRVGFNMDIPTLRILSATNRENRDAVERYLEEIDPLLKDGMTWRFDSPTVPEVWIEIRGTIA